MKPVAIAAAFLIFGVSTAQVRHVQPSALAKRCASDLAWETELEAALTKAKERKCHVLWYAPTVPGSPMDRKPVVDLYMRSGFFSDPDLRPLLSSFVLLKRRPSRQEAKRYSLRPFEFIEPGFAVLDATGKLVDRAHGISTFSPAWFARRLAPRIAHAEGKLASDDALAKNKAAWLRRARLLGDPEHAREVIRESGGVRGPEAAVQFALLWLGDGDVARARKALEGVKTSRARFVSAVCDFYEGQHDKARAGWRQLAKDESGAIAWRAAAEAEGFGPIARGFYSYRDLPRDLTSAKLESLSGTTVPRKVSDVPLMRDRSVKFLLSMQNERGGFEDSNYDFGGLDSLPNVYVAVTALCCEALLASRDIDQVACDEAVRRGLAYVVDPNRRNEEDKDEWIWARAYAIELLAAVLESRVQIQGWPRERLSRELGAIAQDILTRQQSSGAFRHEYANPFATASTLLALKRATAFGIKLPEPQIERALASLERCRTSRGAFSYGQVRRGKARASVVASAGRMPLCESALFSWGKGSAERLGVALDAAFEHHNELEKTRKYDDHAGRYAYGGFFFWYDMLARSRAMHRFPSSFAERVAKWRKKQLETVVAISEIDACFVDSHELGKCYGTAMALLCLASKRDK